MLLFALVLAAPAASAHAFLEASTPPANGSLEPGAGVVALRFTELVDPEHTEATLLASDGGRSTRLTFPSQRPYEVRVEFEPLVPGQYTLDWWAVGVDGHAAAGSIRFSVGQEVADPVAPHAYDAGRVDEGLERAEAVGRALFMAGLLPVLGVPVFVSEVAGIRTWPQRVTWTMAGAAVVGVVGAALSLGVLARTIEGGLVEAAQATAGKVLLAKMALLSGAGALAAAATQTAARRGLALGAVLPAFLATVLHSMGGHGVLAPDAGEGVAGHVGMTLHLVVAGIWLGGVVGFILLLPGRDRQDATDLIGRFSPLALVSVIVVAATGLYQAIIHLPRGTDGGAYLHLVWWKVGLLVALVGFGAWHLFWIRPRLARGMRVQRLLGRSLRAEAVVLFSVIGVAGLLAAVPVPAVPPSGSDGPFAVAESEARLGDYTARLAVLTDPVRANTTYEMMLELHARTSRGVGLAQFDWWLVGPEGARHALPAPHQVEPGRWTAAFVVPGPGSWGVAVALQEPRRDEHTFHVRVLPSAA